MHGFAGGRPFDISGRICMAIEENAGALLNVFFLQSALFFRLYA
jgi:hypothetical protein